MLLPPNAAGKRPMQHQPTAQRWAISLADIAMLLACVLYVGGQAGATGSSPLQSISHVAAKQIFADDEARIHTNGDAYLRAMVQNLPTGSQLTIEVPVEKHTKNGSASAIRRFDDWELAAARTAALGRAVAALNPALPPPVLTTPHVGRGTPDIVFTRGSNPDQIRLAQSLQAAQP